MMRGMRELLLLRHAKSSWDDAALDDHERTLNKRGKRDAPRIGRHLRAEGCVPEHIVSSTAVRARTTAGKVAEACGYAGNIVLTRRLYLAEAASCLELLRELPAGAARVMLVGHNPCFEELVEHLTARAERMPTAAVARIALDIADWSALRPGTRGELLALWRPKQLPD
jgi:phosphohistidine phosphatase